MNSLADASVNYSDVVEKMKEGLPEEVKSLLSKALEMSK